MTSPVRCSGGGRTFASLEEARASSPEPGDVVWIRDIGQIAPPFVWSTDPRRGRWRLRPYQLADGHCGRLLMVNDRDQHNPASVVPPDFEVRLDLPGWYAIWIGVPMIHLRPTLGPPTLGGVDVALDGEPAYVHLCPERGTRKGRVMGPTGVEVMCFWKCAALDGRSLRLRVPYGTFFSFPWGLVRASVSSVRLVKLSEDEVVEYRRDASNPTNKRVIACSDGFSHYWFAGEPGKGIDARFVQQYRDSDVKMLFFQTPATGVASWPSRVTTLLGEGVPDEAWGSLRRGDRRAYEYIQWAVRNGEEGIGVISRLCREAGLECHASLRMNLFFKANGKIFDNSLEKFFNGSFWHQHPELRKPGSTQLDFSLPAARQFILDILMELAANYDLDGINLDFTRWPPVADPAHHDPQVLTTFILDIRRSLDQIARKKRRKLALSATVVEGYHAGMTLEEQKIDLEAWLATRKLDFICVEAWEQQKYLDLARKYGTPFYSVQDQESFNTPGGYRDDPEWQQPDRPDEDPLPGEELEEAPHLNNTLDPTEYDRGFLARYQLGVDGICLVNGGGNFVRRLGHVEEMAERVSTGRAWGQEVGANICVS